MGPFLKKLRIPIRVENGATSNPVTSNGIVSPPHLLSLLHKGISEAKPDRLFYIESPKTGYLIADN